MRTLVWSMYIYEICLSADMLLFYFKNVVIPLNIYIYDTSWVHVLCFYDKFRLSSACAMLIRQVSTFICMYYASTTHFHFHLHVLCFDDTVRLSSACAMLLRQASTFICMCYASTPSFDFHLHNLCYFDKLLLSSVFA